MLTWREVWLYIRMFLRWWWVILLAMGVAGGTAFYLSRQQPKFYNTRVAVMVGESFNASSPNELSFGVSNTLARFYGELAKREPILKPVTEQLKLPFPWQVLTTGMVYTSVNAQANLLEIWVTDTNPERAAAIANKIAQELIRFSPNSPEKMAEQRSIIEEQIRGTEENLKSVEAKIADLKARQVRLESAVDLRMVEDQLSELERARDRFQTTYNQQVSLRNSSAVNSLSVFEAASVPTSPMPSKQMVTVAMASGGGLLLALVAILLLDRLDERWRTSRDLRGRFNINELGTAPVGVPMVMAGDQATARELAVSEVHTQILLAAIDRDIHTLMLSSPYPSEGRSALAVDLAELFARSGYRVLLVDADIRATHLTSLIGENNETPRPVVVHNGDVKMWSYLQPTPIDKVMLLGRRIGEDGRPLVPSLPWPELVQSLDRAADVIIFDGPSALSSADAAMLAPLVDGVVLTLDPKRDIRSIVLQSRSRLLRRRGAKLLGAVVLEAARPVKASKLARRMQADPSLPLLNPGGVTHEEEANTDEPGRAGQAGASA